MPLLLSFGGNWLLPQNARAALDFVLPRVNLTSAYLLVFGGVLLLDSIAREEGVSAGWTVYPPLSGLTFHSSSAISVAILALHVLGLSSEGGSITFLATILAASRNAMTPFVIDIFTWTVLVASVLLILTLPILGGGITLLFFDRNLNFSAFSSMVAGDPVLFQHLFWYFGHPEVYVIILPAFGVITVTLLGNSGLVPTIFPGMAAAIGSIGTVGFFVWAHHLYVAGISEDSRIYFASATMVIAVPTAVKIFSWVSGLARKMLPSPEIALVYSFLVCFTFGGFTGVLLSNSSLDVVYHDTYFVVGHFHYVFVHRGTFCRINLGPGRWRKNGVLYWALRNRKNVRVICPQRNQLTIWSAALCRGRGSPEADSSIRRTAPNSGGNFQFLHFGAFGGSGITRGLGIYHRMPTHQYPGSNPTPGHRNFTVATISIASSPAAHSG